MPKITKPLLKRILSYLKPYWVKFVFVFIAIVIAAVVGLVPSIVTGKIVDEALVGTDLVYLAQLLLIALAAMVASQLIGVVENYINAWISQHIIFDMRNEMYGHLQSMPHSFFTTEKQGDIITRMDTDISGVSSVISGTLSKIVSNVATIITTLVAMFTMSWKLAIVGLLVLPLLILPTRKAGKARLKYAAQTQAKTDEMNQIINETLSASGSLLVKMFTHEKQEAAKFRTVNKDVTDLSMKETRSTSVFGVVMGMFTQLGPLLIYFAGGVLIIMKYDPTLTVGTVTAMVSFVNRLYRPVESLLNLQVTFTRSLALFTRIFDYLDRVNTIVSPENGQKPDVQQQSIRYDHVAFGYEPDSLILKDVDFTIPGGKMFAIVGPSGSGKSTVVNLIPRLYDVASGSVTVAGVDVRDFDLTYLRQCVGVVTQEAYLFNGTILDNLRYAKEDATMEEVENACRIANIHDFIVSQPDGYNAPVGNRGLKLSGGEKQRLSLARVILKDPKILILDEATSALDSISENAIQQALEQLMVGRTSIVIAHRLSTILKADQILVVKDGAIAEQGTHEELLGLGGVYSELFNTQFSHVLEQAKVPGAYAEAYADAFAADGSATALRTYGLDEGPFAHLDIQSLGTEYDVRRLTEEDITDIHLLMRTNRHYYRQLGQRPWGLRLTEIVTNLPDAPEGARNYFAGFYDSSDDLVAILDLIAGYPDEHSAYIGWFMVDAGLQGQGIGSSIFADVRASLQAQGYTRLILQCPQVSKSAQQFWTEQGFATDGVVDNSGDYPVITMERRI